MPEKLTKDKIQSNDVLCCKSSFAFGHSGNLKFRKLIRRYRPVYQASPKTQKQTFIQNIIAAVHESNGRFLRPADENRDPKATSFLWVHLTGEQLQSKVGHALRAGGTKPKRSSKAPPSPAVHLSMTPCHPFMMLAPSTCVSRIHETDKREDEGDVPMTSMTARQVSEEFASPLRERPFEYFMNHQRSLIASLQEEQEYDSDDSIILAPLLNQESEEDAAPVPPSLVVVETNGHLRESRATPQEIDLFDMLRDVDFNDIELSCPETISLIEF